MTTVLQPGVGRDATPWPQLVRREAIAGFRAQAGRVAGTIISEIRRKVPEMAQPLSGPVGEILTSAVQAAVLRGVDSLLEPRAASPDNGQAMFRSVGTLAFEGGCTTEALRTAYRVGERVLCERVWTYGVAHGVPGPALRALLTTISRQVEKLCLVALEGYSAAPSTSSDTLARWRCRLLRLLLDGRSADPQVLADATRAARWTTPDSLVAVALRPPDHPAQPVLGDLSSSVLADLDSPRPCLIAATEDADPAMLAEAFPGWLVAVGPPVELADVYASLRVARRAIDLTERKLITGPVIDCVSSALTLTLFADDVLINELVRRRLAPLTDLTARQRERVLVTLDAWLATRGQAAAVAARLGVHPQTVRYRVHQIEQLFGDALGDPQARFELELSVRAELLRATAAELPAGVKGG